MPQSPDKPIVHLGCDGANRVVRRPAGDLPPVMGRAGGICIARQIVPYSWQQFLIKFSRMVRKSNFAGNLCSYNLREPRKCSGRRSGRRICFRLGRRSFLKTPRRGGMPTGGLWCCDRQHALGQVHCSFASMRDLDWNQNRGFHSLVPVLTANRMHFFPKKEPRDTEFRIAGATGATGMAPSAAT